ncbi:hypothetical protein ATY37_14780 [Vibrio cidicii]|uniref:Uncharacterized protein n=1 Tax=Vibrio cidicii TaxID=1763883 RepID=A0A151KYJ0_9VIBR|nr:hypothetical protein [Vibrio cidicii]KYN88870.1 hypothetical protein ATY37_14780 [Vibrio cidicii]
MKFSPEVIEELFQRSIRIDNIFYMQLVTACDQLPESFWEVFEDHGDILDLIGLADKNVADYSMLRTKSDLHEFLHDHNHRIHGVLIRFSHPVPRDFKFTGDGDFLSCSSGWGISTEHLAYGETLEDALVNAISIHEKHFEECMREAAAQAEVESNHDE